MPTFRYSSFHLCDTNHCSMHTRITASIFQASHLWQNTIGSISFTYTMSTLRLKCKSCISLCI